MGLRLVALSLVAVALTAQSTRPPTTPGGTGKVWVDVTGTPTINDCAKFTGSSTIQSVACSSGGGVADPGSNGIMKRTALNVTAPAVAGTDYVVPAGNVATATALAANGSNCSSGQYPKGVDASGAAESCAAIPAADVPDLDASKVTTGTFSISRLATGTPDGTKFVRDDGTLAAPSFSTSGATHGYISPFPFMGSSITMANNATSTTIRAIRVVVPVQTTIQSANVHVGVGNAGDSLVAALYSGDGATRIAHCAISVAAANAQKCTFAPVTVSPGWYIMAWVGTSATPTILGTGSNTNWANAWNGNAPIIGTCSGSLSGLTPPSTCTFTGSAQLITALAFTN